MAKTKRPKKQRDDTSLDIDENALDEEWVNQPKLYRQYATELADASDLYERACSNTKLVEAECYLDISENFEKFGLDKRTESGIKALIPTHEDYKEALDYEHTTKHKVDLLKGIVHSLSHRKTALEKLVDLRLADYFAEPKARTKSSRQVMDDIRTEKVLSRKRRSK